MKADKLLLLQSKKMKRQANGNWLCVLRTCPLYGQEFWTSSGAAAHARSESHSGALTRGLEVFDVRFKIGDQYEYGCSVAENASSIHIINRSRSYARYSKREHQITFHIKYYCGAYPANKNLRLLDGAKATDLCLSGDYHMCNNCAGVEANLASQ